MAVATSKRTQTNFGVNAVWKYLTWKNVVREDIDIGEYGETCRARSSRLLMDSGLILFCARSEGAALTTRCAGASRASAGASSSCSTCKTVPNQGSRPNEKRTGTLAFVHGERGSATARAYNGGLGAPPPVRSRGKAPGQGSRGRSPPEAENILKCRQHIFAVNYDENLSMKHKTTA